MNTVQIVGNLTRDPQLRRTNAGTAVASFSVAVNRTLRDANGGQREMTDFINVVAWGALAEAAGNQLHKGTRVFVEGRYSTRSYETPDGQKRYITEVNANLIALPLRITAGGNPAYDGDQSRGNFEQFGEPRAQYENEEIPF